MAEQGTHKPLVVSSNLTLAIYGHIYAAQSVHDCHTLWSPRSQLGYGGGFVLSSGHPSLHRDFRSNL